MVTFDGNKFMYHIDNKLVGVYSITYDVIFVDKQYRRKGIGTALVAARIAMQPDYRAITVSEASRALFAKFNGSCEDVSDTFNAEMEKHFDKMDINRFVSNVLKENVSF